MKQIYIVMAVILGLVILIAAITHNKNKKKLQNLKQSAIQSGIVTSAEVSTLNFGELRLLLMQRGWSENKIELLYK